MHVQNQRRTTINGKRNTVSSRGSRVGCTAQAKYEAIRAQIAEHYQQAREIRNQADKMKEMLATAPFGGRRLALSEGVPGFGTHRFSDTGGPGGGRGGKPSPDRQNQIDWNEQGLYSGRDRNSSGGIKRRMVVRVRVKVKAYLKGLRSRLNLHPILVLKPRTEKLNLQVTIMVDLEKRKS